MSYFWIQGNALDTHPDKLSRIKSQTQQVRQETLSVSRALSSSIKSAGNINNRIQSVTYSMQDIEEKTVSLSNAARAIATAYWSADQKISSLRNGGGFGGPSTFGGGDGFNGGGGRIKQEDIENTIVSLLDSIQDSGQNAGIISTILTLLSIIPSLNIDSASYSFFSDTSDFAKLMKILEKGFSTETYKELTSLFGKFITKTQGIKGASAFGTKFVISWFANWINKAYSEANAKYGAGITTWQMAGVTTTALADSFGETVFDTGKNISRFLGDLLYGGKGSLAAAYEKHGYEFSWGGMKGALSEIGTFIWDSSSTWVASWWPKS